MEQKEIKRNMEKSAAREKRRKKRKKVVWMQRGLIALFLVLVIAGGSLFAYNMTPEVQVKKQLKAANAYIEEENYDQAIASCEEALKIDSYSVSAYRAMAGAYLTQEDAESAEKILYQGWEVTQDESLFDYYCTVQLNEAVAEINAQNCTFATLEKCIFVLEEDPDNTDVYALLDACYDRLLSAEAGTENLLCNTETESSYNYATYQALMDRMLAVYTRVPTDALKEEILKFAVPGGELFQVDMECLQEYVKLLERVAQVGESAEVSELLACVSKAVEMQDVFAEAFTIFESGEFEAIKDFMQSDVYISIRDQFMDGTMEYWDGKTYVPVSREKVELKHTDGSWSFSFADYEKYPEANGVVNVWAAKQEDDGVQRLCISYEPALENGEYYPHTTYEFIYLYSNVKINGVYVPQMNYRFETRVATPEGTTTQVIGDWGGEHEFDMEF